MNASDSGTPPTDIFRRFSPHETGQSPQGDGFVIELIGPDGGLLCKNNPVPDFFSSTGLLKTVQTAVPVIGTLRTEISQLTATTPLTRLEVGLEPGLQSVAYVGMDLAWAPTDAIDLSPLPVKLKGGLLQLCFLNSAGGDPDWNASIMAVAQIFDLDALADFEIGRSKISVWGRCESPTPMPPGLGSGSSAVQIPSGLSRYFTADLTIASFQALLDFEDSSYSVAIQIDGAMGWKAFSLGMLELRLAYSGGTPSFSLTTLAMVGSVPIQLTMDGDGQGDLGFHGSAEFGSGAKLNEFITAVCQQIGVTPSPTLPFDFELTSIAVGLREQTVGTTKSLSFSAECAGALLLEETGTSIALDLRLEKNAGNLDVTLMVGGLSVKLSEGGETVCFAAKPQPGSTPMLTFGAIVRMLRLRALEDVPVDVSVGLDGILIAAGPAPAGGGRRPVLFGVQLDVSGFAELKGPVIDIVTAGGGSLGLGSVTFLAANQAWTADELAALPDSGGLTLPTTVPKGPSVVATLKTGSETTIAPLMQSSESAPEAASSPSSSPSPPPVAMASTSSTATRWFNVQRRAGPLLLNRLGFALGKDGSGNERVTIDLDAAFTAGGLMLGLSGFSVAFPLSWRMSVDDIAIGLSGMQLAFTRGPLSIGGGFLHQTQGTTDVYLGDVMIDTGTLSLAAVGEYASINGSPSMFVYVSLSDPLGGPPPFFVNGLAAGFGYSSRLALPTKASEVAGFVLVQAATGKATLSPDAISASITPAQGYDWLAAGVHFTSFELLQSLAVLVVTFGNELQVELLGQAELAIPPASSDRLAYAQVDLLATYSPATGEFGAFGQLTQNSYVLSRDCHLTGGFAFCLWETGDFVASFGGYNPSYDYASRGYPAVARLQLLWQIDSHTSVKGTEYFAITPGAMMAGGSLAATWNSGILSAWFDVAVDLYLAWKPFHYAGDFSMSLGVSFSLHIWFVNIHFSFHVGASLQAQGPPFRGTAHIDLDVISFDVSFGPPANVPQPLDWVAFRAMLPGKGDSDLLSAKIASGLVPTKYKGANVQGTTWLGLVDGTHFRFHVESAMPVTDGRGICAMGTYGQPEGVRPMQKGFTDSALTVTLTHESTGVKVLSAEPAQPVVATPVTRSIPLAHWGAPGATSLNDGSIEGALTGVRLEGGRPLPARETPAIDVSLLTDTTHFQCALSADPVMPMNAFPTAAFVPPAGPAKPESVAPGVDAELARMGVLPAGA